jgi:hypothetical protein
MEKYLVPDTIQYILSFLNEKDLFEYGLSSKQSYESSNKQWKKRFEEKVKMKYNENFTDNWFFQYKKYQKRVFNSTLRVILTEISDAKNFSDANKSFINMLEYIQQNKQILEYKDMKTLKNHIKNKLLYFQNDEELGDITERFFRELFKKEYEDIYFYHLNLLFN